MQAVDLVPISAEAARSVIGSTKPTGTLFAADYPTEFSIEVAQSIDDGEPLGPFFLVRTADQVVVGEIGGTLIDRSTLEIGYAVVRSAQGRGYATSAVRRLIELARAHPSIDRLIARTPLDRPASERVLEKSGFRCTGEIHEMYGGAVIPVREWECQLSGV